jgi:glutamate 5-kinase
MSAGIQPGGRGRCPRFRGVQIAKGISNYSAAELEKIRGKKNREIREILGEHITRKSSTATI